MANGILIAPDATVLDAAPTWVSLLDVAGVKVQKVTWVRGRSSPRDKVNVGRATIEGKDTTGALDPTNTSSVFWDAIAGATKINPMMQARIEIPNPVTATWVPQFTGYVYNWHYELSETGEWFDFRLDLVDDLQILSDAEVIPGRAGSASVAAEYRGNAVYAAQQVDDRIRAALADAALSAGAYEWPAGRMVIFSGNVAVQQGVYPLKTTILTVIDNACDAEFAGGLATRYIDKAGVFTFHGRYARLNPADVSYGIDTWQVGDMAAFNTNPAVVALSASQLAFNRSAENLINNALATPKGIKDADIAGQFVHDDPSILKYSARSITFDGLETLRGDESSPGPFLSANAEVKQYGQFWVDNFKKPRDQPETMVFKMEDPASPHAAPTNDFICNCELNDIVHLKTTHPGGGGFDDDFFLESLDGEAIPSGVEGMWDVTLKVEVSPRGYFSVDGFAT
jgi:hypothetical protein